MFAGGWGSGGRDHFDRAAPLYRSIAEMAALRRTHRLFSRGVPEVLRDNAGGPGVLAYLVRHGRQRALVAFNTAEHEVLLDGLELGAGAQLRGLFGIDGRPDDQRVLAQGRLNLVLPARSGQVWLLAAAASPALRTPTEPPTLKVNALDQSVVGGDFAVSGEAPGMGSLLLVIDGDLAQAQRITPQADGRWQAVVDTSRFVDAAANHRLVAMARDGNAAPVRATLAQTFRVNATGCRWPT
ncbi:MAG: hypothetical protein IPP44_14985 [Ideonella sp.]|nr:hypothetical protein [Ideonella sp.]